MRMLGPGTIGAGNFPGGVPGGVATPFRHGPAAGAFRSGAFHNQFGRFGFGRQFGNGFGLPYWGVDPFYGYNSFVDPFYAGNMNEYEHPAQPSVIVLMPQMQPAPPPMPAPNPVRPETRDYNWPASASASASASGSDTAVFTLVSRDQRVESAIAVTVQGNRIFYVTPDGGHKEMSMDALDRERTRQRNAEKQLKLPWLG